MSKRKKNFIIGCTFFALAIFTACVLPFILKFYDLYYFMPVSFYEKLVIIFSTIGLGYFFTNDKYHSKEIMVIFLGILFVIALRFLPL